MSVTAPQPPATPPEGLRRCHRCAAELEPAQEWCLNCGAAASTRVESPSGWRVLSGLAIGGFLVALAALAVAFLVATNDPQPLQIAATPTPAPASPPVADATPAPAATAEPGTGGAAAPEATVAPDATPEPDGTPAPEATTAPADTEVERWPDATSAWTIVLFSAEDRPTAAAKARELAAAGTPVGILHSNDFASLRRGYWVVFSGQYDDAEQASAALATLAGSSDGAYVRYVEPR